MEERCHRSELCCPLPLMEADTNTKRITKEREREDHFTVSLCCDGTIVIVAHVTFLGTGGVSSRPIKRQTHLHTPSSSLSRRDPQSAMDTLHHTHPSFARYGIPPWLVCLRDDGCESSWNRCSLGGNIPYGSVTIKPSLLYTTFPVV